MGERALQPAHEARVGRIVGRVWPHANPKGEVWYSTVISREFLDPGGTVRTAQSFGRDDLPAVAEVARRCREWVDANR